MKINQIILETSTTAGVIATVDKPLGAVQTRPQVSGLKPIDQLGGKKKGPYANSLSEGAVKQYSMDLKELTDEEFKKKYKKTKQEARKAMKEKPSQVDEAKLEEDDIILVPGQGRIRKSGFIKHDPDRAEHEGQTLKNSLHTIIRVASHLDKELSVRDNFPEWVSEKIGSVKSNMVAVMDYLISAKEMSHDSDAMEGMTGAGVIAGGPQYESQLDELSKDTLRSYVTKQPERIKGPQGLARTNPSKASRIVDPAKGDIRKALTKIKDPKYGNAEPSMKEGAKVDRMVKHVAQSEKKLGHSAKEAETIAWKTANKRGMLDNKNKKAK